MSLSISTPESVSLWAKERLMGAARATIMTQGMRILGFIVALP
jgi:hypothetical protein